jgi:hypothetical protein
MATEMLAMVVGEWKKMRMRKKMAAISLLKEAKALDAGAEAETLALMKAGGYPKSQAAWPNQDL